MADEKKIIDVEVREKGLDELNADLAKTEQSFKDVDKAADKTTKSVDDVASNGGAIAILDSLTGGLATRMRDAYEASKLLNFSLKGMKTALIATGIGAFVVAIGLVVAYWDDIVELIGGANKALEKQIRLRDELLDDLDTELKLLEVKEKILNAEGKSTREIKEQREKILRLQIEQGVLQATELETQLTLETSKANELKWWEKLLNLRAGPMTVAVAEIDEEENNALREKKAQIDAIILATETAKLALIELLAPESAEGEGARGEDQMGAEESDPLGIVSGVPIGDLKDFIDFEAGLIGAARKEDLKNQSRNATAKIKIAEQEFYAKQELLFASANAIMAFGDLVGQQTAAGKALASAGALINTFLGITEVWRAQTILPEPYGTIAKIASTITVAASGFAAVKNINKVKIPSVSISNPVFSGGGGGGYSAPAPPSIQQPDFNVVGNSGVNQLADVIAEQEKKPVKAYVVSEEVESVGELDRRIERSATIG